MQIINNEKIVYFDVDGTLVLPYQPGILPNNPIIKVYDPVKGQFITMISHSPNVRLLLEEKHRGSFVIVWSRSGYEWAESVIKALEIEKHVDLVMSKPLVYVDDVPIEEWLPYRVFLEPNVNYKR